MAIIPKLIAQPKWFSSSPELKPGDVVYFRKTENELSSNWIVGQVDAHVKPIKLVKKADGVYAVKKQGDDKKSCNCRCYAHCKMNEHSVRGKVANVALATKIDMQSKPNIDYYRIYDQSLKDELDDNDVEDSMEKVCHEDKLFQMITAIGVDFN